MSKIFSSGVWKGFEMNTALVLTLRTPILTNCTLSWISGSNRTWYYIWIINSKQFAWNIVSDLISKTTINFKNVVCFCLWIGKYYHVRNVITASGLRSDFRYMMKRAQVFVIFFVCVKTVHYATHTEPDNCDQCYFWSIKAHSPIEKYICNI